jgi:endonuclease YncB( thermonuclease family)
VTAQRLATTLLLLISLTACADPGREAIPATTRSPLVGEVVAVGDGDSITVKDEANTEHRVRLQGSDAPELGQAFGSRSKRALSDKVFGERVSIAWEERDQYDRILGHVHLGERYINEEMIAEGMAWHYKRYSSDERLAEAEKLARGERRGLWRDDKPIPPWEYRRTESQRR